MLGFARICDCSHVASYHRITKAQYVKERAVRATIYHECLYADCNCEQFIEVERINCRQVNYR